MTRRLLLTAALVLALCCQPVAVAAGPALGGGSTGATPTTDTTSPEPAVGPATTVPDLAPGSEWLADVSAAGADAATASRSTVGATTGPATASDIVVEKTLRLTPSEPGTVAATYTYRIPDAVSQLTTRIGAADLAIQSTTRFEQEGGGLRWTGEGDTASVTFTFRVNRTGGGARATGADHRDTGLSFADAGDWAIAPIPTIAANWRQTAGADVSLRSTTAVDGSGVAGGSMAYLGEYESVERAGTEQTLQLVVPAAAELRESPTAILDSLTAASAALRIGARDDRVVVIAAPTSVSWGSKGLQYGAAEAWVEADARLDTPNNVWVHEYVHTRQAFNVSRPDGTSDTRWLTEASADYYAALLTLKQGRISYDAFRSRLARGGDDPYDDAVMTEPSTWDGTGANYLKGALVLGAVDREIRARTDGARSLQTVLRGVNEYDDADGSGREDLVPASAYYSLVGNGDEPLREYAVRYASTDAVPETWSQTTHEATFAGLPALFEYRLDAATVESQYRAGSLAAPPTVVPGEAVTLTYAVTNDGGAAGAYDAAVTVDGTVRRTWSGTLAPDETATTTVTVAFETPGEYTVQIGGQRTTVEVRELGTARVTNLSAASEPTDAGADVTLTATVANEGAVPAERTLTYVRDGQVVDEVTVTLAPGASRTVSRTIPVSGAGEHTVGIRGLDTTTVTIADSGGGGSAPLPAPTPGFGPPAALVALAALVLIGRRRVN